MKQLVDELRRQEQAIMAGGGPKAIARQHEKGRLTARERIAQLLDPQTPFFELGLWSAWGMYQDWGGAPSAGVVTGIGTVAERRVMVIANDATVKAGAFFPMTCKKVLRAQRIAMENRLPLLYLVDSAGVFLRLQDEIFPDEDDFGRIFRNNAVISAAGVPQFAAIMGNCVAGGGSLPVMCDQLLMTEGSGLYLAGPVLVKAAVGQPLVCGTGRLGGVPVGVVANQKGRVKPADGAWQFGGVIYVDSADKAARFIMTCNQSRTPLVFVQNVNGFMVGKDSEQHGIIR